MCWTSGVGASGVVVTAVVACIAVDFGRRRVAWNIVSSKTVARSVIGRSVVTSLVCLCIV